MNDPLTTAERIFIEHWSRRKWQAFRTWLLIGGIGWGGLMSYFMVYDGYSSGKFSSTMFVLLVVVCLLGGCLFGMGMWGVTEFRFRRMLAKDKQDAA